MSGATDDEVARQRHYYAETAARYDRMHGEEPEHAFSLAMLTGMLDYLAARSVLDVGAGTGRAMLHLMRARPELLVRGIEPVPELRERAVAGGVPAEAISGGDGSALAFGPDEFDVVCAFGVLHHVPDPSLVIAEMLRVARRAIFISDSNNFGQGRRWIRVAKQALDAAGLWKLADLVKTRGRGYIVTEGDGVSYSYSVFTNLDQIERACRSVHTINTRAAGRDHYRSASHVALLGIK